MTCVLVRREKASEREERDDILFTDRVLGVRLVIVSFTGCRRHLNEKERSERRGNSRGLTGSLAWKNDEIYLQRRKITRRKTMAKTPVEIVYLIRERGRPFRCREFIFYYCTCVLEVDLLDYYS